MLPLKTLVKLKACSAPGYKAFSEVSLVSHRTLDPRCRRSSMLPLSELLKIRSSPNGRREVARRALLEKPRLKRFDSADYFCTLMKMRGQHQSMKS